MWRVSLQLWTTSSPNLQPHKQAAVSVPVSFTELRPLASCYSLHLVCRALFIPVWRSTETTARSKAAPENFVSMFSFLMNLYDVLPLLCLHFWHLSKRIFLNWPFCGVLKGYRAFSHIRLRHAAPESPCVWSSRARPLCLLNISFLQVFTEILSLDFSLNLLCIQLESRSCATWSFLRR